MAGKAGHRRFGTVRKLPSRRWQARYPGPDGLVRNAPHTFPTKTDAERWLSITESEIIKGDWLDPVLGKMPCSDYFDMWSKGRSVSRRTREEDESLWRNHIREFIGHVRLSDASLDVIRQWRTTVLENGRSEDRTAKCYRLLRAMFNAALDEGRIKRNPCRIKGADRYRTPERPHATVDEVYSLADQIERRFRFLVLLAAFSGLRWGELIGLRRRDLDAESMTVRVGRSVGQSNDGTIAIGPTKSEASVRRVALPDFLRVDLADHLAEFAEEGRGGLLFVGKRGGLLRRGNFHRETGWTKLVIKVGLPEGFHFHDLRHTGNQMAAEAGAITRELMQRMGHSTVRAALIYQHGTGTRDRQIAAEMNQRVTNRRGSGDPA